MGEKAELAALGKLFDEKEDEQDDEEEDDDEYDDEESGGVRDTFDLTLERSNLPHCSNIK